jgi:hypothetical protein
MALTRQSHSANARARKTISLDITASSRDCSVNTNWASQMIGRAAIALLVLLVVSDGVLTAIPLVEAELRS